MPRNADLIKRLLITLIGYKLEDWKIGRVEDAVLPFRAEPYLDTRNKVSGRVEGWKAEADRWKPNPFSNFPTFQSLYFSRLSHPHCCFVAGAAVEGEIC